jgi:hypothetical protein
MAGTTPLAITPEILAFCQSISDRTPIYCEVQPPPPAEIGQCFYNVRSMVAANGGTAIAGWTIWERPGVYLEAEHHSVWLPMLAARPVDVTPKDGRETRILFLPDPKAEFDWVLAKPNIRHALVDDPVIHRFLAAGDAIDASRKPMPNRQVARSPATMMAAARALQDLNAKYP